MGARKPDPAGLAPRQSAALRLQAVLGGEAFSPFTPAEIPEGRDRALANRLVTTALRRRGQIDVMLAELLERGLPKKSGSFEAVLRIALAQLVYLPDLGAHSALYLAVETIKRDAKARHLSGLMNAVLRRAQAVSLRFADLPDRLVLPEAVAARWEAVYGAEALEGFCRALIEGAPLDMTLAGDAEDELIEMLGAEPLMGDSVRLALRDRPVSALPGYAEGRWWVQDAAAALPARLMDLAPGARVLDLCAAPGGKTAQLIKAGHAVTALDADPARLGRLKDNLDRLGQRAEIVAADLLAFSPDAPFDGVLLDAPCSASGTFRRHPEVLWTRTAADIAGRAKLQRAMLARAFDWVRPGGTLIYCVCSLEPEEGEAQADWALATLAGAELAPIRAEEIGGLEGALDGRGLLRTHPGLDPPGAPGGMDGFFAMRLRRRL